MNSDIKISVTLIVPGGTRHLVGVKEIPYTITKQDLTSVKLPKKERNKIVKQGIQKTNDYIWKDAFIHINMTRYAYDYFISPSVPEGYNEKTQKRKWRSLSPENRIEWHIATYASSRGAKEYSYNILED